MNCTGVFFQLAAIRQDRKVRTFGMMSAESWTEDAGFGQLSGGSAHVEIDPTFAEAANTGVDYHVFITPEGETGQLYVTHKTATGFDVREAKGGKSTAQFSYRIMAKQHGMEQARLTDVTEREAKVNAKLAAGRPTLEQMRKAKPMAMPRRPPLPAKPVEAEHAALAR
jgi:hypothetical protein